MRNVPAHAGRSGRRVVSAFIATAFAQNDAKAAKQQWRRVAKRFWPLCGQNALPAQAQGPKARCLDG